MAYFDANATTPLCPAAATAFTEAQRDFWHNPSSPYPLAAAVHNRLEQARATLAQALGCKAEQIVFNSGATEGAHSLFQYFASVFGQQGVVAISAIEHPCVRESAHHFFPQRVVEIPVDANGVVDLAALEAIACGEVAGGKAVGDEETGGEVANGEVASGEVAKVARSGKDVKAKGEGGAVAAFEKTGNPGQVNGRPVLIALMAANNETGALQPWQAALAIARAHGIPFYTDAAQWLGKEAMGGLGEADFISGCAHKFGGIKGTGFLKIGDDFSGFYAQKGGAQENGHRGGTENYPAIAAMLAALHSREAMLYEQQQTWAAGRTVFEAAVTEQIPGTVVHAAQAARLANTSSLLLPRHRNTRWVARLAKRGFCLSTGSACATGKAGPSHVLAAMGLSPEQAERTVRISALWEETTLADWQALAAAFIEVWHELNAEDNSGSRANVISI